MKRLFLCSSFADVANLFVDCAKEDLQGKIIAFIPTASLTEPIRFYVKKGKKALEEAGMIVEEVEITQLPKEEISSILHKLLNSISLNLIILYFSIDLYKESDTDTTITSSMATHKSILLLV